MLNKMFMPLCYIQLIRSRTTCHTSERRFTRVNLVPYHELQVVDKSRCYFTSQPNPEAPEQFRSESMPRFCIWPVAVKGQQEEGRSITVSLPISDVAQSNSVLYWIMVSHGNDRTCMWPTFKTSSALLRMLYVSYGHVFIFGMKFIPPWRISE